MSREVDYLQPVLDWLLEPQTPGVRYLTLRDLLDRPESDPELKAARLAAHQQGEIAAVLAEMHPEGYWVESVPTLTRAGGRSAFRCFT